MTEFDYDLFVIGGGSGGVRAARIAAGFGARVAIAEHDRFGGTCVIRGCIPKKLLVYAAHFREDFADAAGYGWTVREPEFSWPKLIANKNREIARLEGVYAGVLEKDRKSTRLNSSHLGISYAVFCLKKKKKTTTQKTLLNSIRYTTKKTKNDATQLSHANLDKTNHRHHSRHKNDLFSILIRM